MQNQSRSARFGAGSWKVFAALGTSVLLVAVGSTAAVADTLPSGPSTTGLTGLRPSATRVTFRASDKVQASVDVATGNLNLTADLLNLPAVSGSTPITLSYNSRATVAGDAFMGAADSAGWTYGIDGAGSLSIQSDGTTVDYTTADGAIWPFLPVSGSTTAYTSPSGIKAVLTKTSTGWSLAQLDASTTVAFDGTGRPVSVTDRNGTRSRWTGPAV